MMWNDKLEEICICKRFATSVLLVKIKIVNKNLELLVKYYVITFNHHIYPLHCHSHHHSNYHCNRHSHHHIHHHIHLHDVWYYP